MSLNNHKIIFFILGALVIASACFLAYQNSLHNPFIWDDEGLILKNPLIKSWNLWKAFNSDLYVGVGSDSNFWRPVQTFSYMLDYHFWNLDPFGYHLTNIILQILVSILAMLFIYSLSKDMAVSFSSSLLFATCPLHTEAVTYISGRAELLMGLFLVASLLLFIKRQAEKSRVIYLYSSLLLFMVGLLSKELALVFPLVILAYTFYFKRDKLKDRGFFLKNILPFFAISFIYIALRLSLLRFSTVRPSELAQIPLILRVSVLPKVIFSYLKLLILPANLHMSRGLTVPTRLFGIFASWFSLGIIIFTCLYILAYKGGRKASFMLFWSLVFLLPQSGIFPINACIAEHFVYLSSLSFFLLVSYLLHRYLRKELFAFSIIGLAAFYGALTSSRNYEWRNPEVFYKKLLKASPESFQAHNNLGFHYDGLGLFDNAVAEYKRSLEIKPDYFEARFNIANIHFRLGKLDEAKKEYAIIEKSASGAKAGGLQNNIGNIYRIEGKLNEALAKYRLALQLDPGLNVSRFNIAEIYFAKGDVAKAKEEILKALPEINLAHKNPAPYLKIIEGYLRSVKDMSCPVTLYNNLGISFANAGIFDTAIICFQRALELNPQYADAHFNLGLAYWKGGFKRKAAFEFKTALKIDPNHYKAARFLSEIVYKK